MKYLTNYKIFESIEDDIKSYLTDICLDLTDIGFEVTITKNLESLSYSIKNMIELLNYLGR